MKNKKSLAIILLSLSFCFVPILGYGEVKGIEKLKRGFKQLERTVSSYVSKDNRKIKNEVKNRLWEKSIC